MSKLVIPQGDGAPIEAQQELAELAVLFGDTSLDRRLCLLGISCADDLGLAGTEWDHKVERSLRWATVTEVALRLLYRDELEAEIEILDALATALRISRGLAERRCFDAPAIETLLASLQSLVSMLGAGSRVVDTHAAAIASTERHAAETYEWTEAEAILVLASIPVVASMKVADEALAHASDSPVASWRARLGLGFGECQYLSAEVLVALGALDEDCHTTPIRDLARTGLGADGLHFYVSRLEVAARTLSEAIDEVSNDEGVEPIVRTYASSALAAAGIAYAHLVDAGLVA